MFDSEFDAVIEVTAADIRGGVPESNDSCPIALAVKRAFPDAEGVEVDLAKVDIYDGGGDVIATAELPKEGQSFVAEFDCEMDVKPFTLPLHFTPVN